MVDNNDDIESEDDNDSADAAEAEAEASPEEADTDDTPPDTDPLLINTPSPQSTPSSGVDQTADAPGRQRGGRAGESEVDTDISLVIPKCSDGDGDGGGHRDSGRSGRESADTSDGTAGGARPPNQNSLHVNGSGGSGEGRGGAEVENNAPWTEIEWGRGEGESGGAVRRWGRVVQEGEDCGSTGTVVSGELEPPPTREAAAGERGKEEGRESPSLDRGGSRVDLTRAGGSQEAAPTATTPAKGVAGEPPPKSGGRSKKERRRASGSRAPKALVLSSGESRWIKLFARKCGSAYLLCCLRLLRFQIPDPEGNDELKTSQLALILTKLAFWYQCENLHIERRRLPCRSLSYILFLSCDYKGNRGRGSSDRSIARQRPRGGSGDDAARRASDAALQVNLAATLPCKRKGRAENINLAYFGRRLKFRRKQPILNICFKNVGQKVDLFAARVKVSAPLPGTPPMHPLPQKAASSVLAACASSSSSRGPMGKSRRRIRSLPDSGRFTPDAGGTGSGGGGSGASRASSTSSRGGVSRGRNRGGGGSLSSRGGLAGHSPSTAGAPESAPRSGSSLVDAAPDGGGGDMVTVGVVKRGGNLRWISPTNLTSSSGGVSEVKSASYFIVYAVSIYLDEQVVLRG